MSTCRFVDIGSDLEGLTGPVGWKAGKPGRRPPGQGGGVWPVGSGALSLLWERLMWTLRPPAAWRRYAMSMRLVCDWVVPCVLCEDPIEHVTIWRDDSKRKELMTRENLPHLCACMEKLIRERHA